MKICMISKYPPIEGGVSAKSYWFARALGEKGHEVFVVTNSWSVENEFREDIPKEEMHLLEPKNVRLFSLKREKPIVRIMNSDYYIARLTNLAIDIVKRHNPDAVYAHYLLPYGIVGLFVKKLTNKPLIVRHAGSDIGRLCNNPFLKTIFSEVFRNADYTIAYSNTKPFLTKKGLSIKNAKNLGPQGVNLEYFNKKIKPFDLSKFGVDKGIPVFSYFGKISRMKRVHEFVDAASRIKKDFRIVFVVGDGKIVQDFKHYISSKNMLDKCVFLLFQPPWRIPSIMRASTCVVSPESHEVNLPLGVHNPQIAREAMACGKCCIIGRGVSQKGVYKNAKEGKHLLVVNPEDIEDFSKKLNMIIENPSIAEEIGKNAHEFAKRYETDNFVKNFENLWDS